jgi:hypothetical protein
MELVHHISQRTQELFEALEQVKQLQELALEASLWIESMRTKVVIPSLISLPVPVSPLPSCTCSSSSSLFLFLFLTCSTLFLLLFFFFSHILILIFFFQMNQMDQSLVGVNLAILQKHLRKRNCELVYKVCLLFALFIVIFSHACSSFCDSFSLSLSTPLQKLKQLQTIKQVNASIKLLLLSHSDFNSAFSLIGKTQQRISSRLSGIRCSKILNEQLGELKDAMERQLQQEFLRLVMISCSSASSVLPLLFLYLFLFLFFFSSCSFSSCFLVTYHFSQNYQVTKSFRHNIDRNTHTNGTRRTCTCGRTTERVRRRRRKVEFGHPGTS